MSKTTHHKGAKGYQLKRLIACRPKPGTVASLGLQVRLVPIDEDRDRELARLILSFETLRTECERLFQQSIDLLKSNSR